MLALVRRALPLLAALALLYAAEARAQSTHLVWPEIGAGPAGFVFNGAGGGAWQIDLSIGLERDGDPLRIFGGILRADFLLLSSEGGGLNSVDALRIDLAPLFTASSSFKYGSPFFRLGAGPLLSIAGSDPSGGLGVGLHGEAAAGLKCYMDVAIDVRASFDALGPSVGVAALFRVNPLFWKFFEKRGYGY